MDGLIGWLKGFQKPPKQLFLVHGEPEVKIEFAKTIKERVGFDAIPVNVNSEYELQHSGEVVTMKEAIAEAVDERKINEARDNLYNVRRRLEDIIYNTDLSVDNTTDPEKLAKINNIILELEKSAINLGAVITESEEDERIEMTDEQRQQLREAREEKIREKKKEKKSAKK
jgi:metallo-beta-lactamase family protein